MYRILFLGDSITDCHRLYSDDGLGFGYVKMISERLPKSIINRGFDGFTAYDVKRRLSNDLETKPDLVSLLVGVNDIPSLMAGGESLKDFENHYEDILKGLKGYKTLVILPFVFNTPAELVTWQPTLENITDIIKGLCKKYSIPCLPMQDIFKAAAKTLGEEELTVDGVHLTETGHKILCDNWMNFYDTQKQRIGL